MELYFNELSIKNTDEIRQENIRAIVRIYRELLKYEVTTCRIAADDNTRLFQMISDTPDSVNIKNFYFSFFRSPYESETAEKSQDEYFGHRWTYTISMFRLSRLSGMQIRRMSEIYARRDMWLYMFRRFGIERVQSH